LPYRFSQILSYLRAALAARNELSGAGTAVSRPRPVSRPIKLIP
jgi:hypothetical protein